MNAPSTMVPIFEKATVEDFGSTAGYFAPKPRKNSIVFATTIEARQEAMAAAEEEVALRAQAMQEELARARAEAGSAVKGARARAVPASKPPATRASGLEEPIMGSGWATGITASSQTAAMRAAQADAARQAARVAARLASVRGSAEEVTTAVAAPPAAAHVAVGTVASAKQAAQATDEAGAAAVVPATATEVSATVPKRRVRSSEVDSSWAVLGQTSGNNPRAVGLM